MKILLLFLVLLVGCININPVSDSKYIDYSKPRNIDVDNNIVDDDIDNDFNNTNDSVLPIITDNTRFYTLGFFHITNFGKTKNDNKKILDTIVDVIRDYDIIILQDVREKENLMLVPMEMVSNDNTVFMYSNRVTPGRYIQYDKNGFKNTPFMMEFKIEDYRFVLLNVNVNPYDSEEEIKKIDEVVDWVMKEYQEGDIIIMGTLYADCSYFNTFSSTLNDYIWIIDESWDTTTSTKTDCSYDRILMTQNKNNVYDWGVDNMDDETNGNLILKQAVSDHYPVYMRLMFN
jgi:hypothetical protein